MLDEGERIERDLYKIDFEASSLEALTLSCEKSLKAKQQLLETRQKELEEARQRVAEISAGITERLGRIFGGLIRSRRRTAEC